MAATLPQYELSLFDYWRILRKRRMIVLTTVAVVLGLTNFYLRYQIPIYRTAAKIKLERQAMVSGNFFQSLQSPYENPIVTEAGVIESRVIAEGVARKLTSSSTAKSPAQFQAMVDRVQATVKAEPVTDTNIIRIVVTGTEPHWITDVANFTAEVYVDFNLREKNRQVQKVREFVDAQVTQSEARLKADEEALKRMRVDGTATGTGVVIQNRITDLETRLSELLPKLTEAHPDVRRIREQLPALHTQLQSLPDAELEYARLTRDAEVNEKTYRSLRERLEEARIAEAEKVADASIIERATLPGGPLGTRRRISFAVGAILGFLIGCVFAFIFETFDTSIGTIEDIETLLGVPVLAVIPHMGNPEQKSGQARPGFWTRIIRRSQRLRHEDKLVLHVHYFPSSVVAEAYRILRTNLKCSAERKVILVTSAGPSEGKTSVLSNLGMVTAQGGARTMLLTCDLRKPELWRIFGLPKEGGLAEVLQGSLSSEQATRGLSDFVLGKFGFDETVKNPYLANLSVITAGHFQDNPTELIGSKGMQELIQKLRAQYDVIFLDAPPILPVADSLLLAPQADGVVLVYEVGRIARAALLRAKMQLDSVGAKIIGVVLNHVRPEVETHPNYYYYQRYTYADKEGAAAKPAAAAKRS